MKQQGSKINYFAASKVCRIILLIEVALIVILQLVWHSDVSDRLSFVLGGQCCILLLLAIGWYYRGKKK